MDSRLGLLRHWVCESLKRTVCSTKLTLDLDPPVGRVRLSIFPLLVSDGAHFLPHMIDLLCSFPFFPLLLPSSRRQVKETSLFLLCLLACISLRIPWESGT